MPSPGSPQAFGDFPPEIVDLIVHQLARWKDRRTLLNLACTSHWLAALCLPLVKSIRCESARLSISRGWSLSVGESIGLKTRIYLQRLKDQGKSLDNIHRLILVIDRFSPWGAEFFEPESWQALIDDLVARIPSLDEVLYEGSSSLLGLPLCLYNAIQKHHPHCTFLVRTIHLKNTHPLLGDPHGVMFLSAREIRGTGIQLPGGWRTNWIEMLRHDMIRGLPSSSSWDPRNCGFGFERIRYTSYSIGPEHDWFRIQFIKRADDPPLEKIQCLLIREYVATTVNSLVAWRDITDFSVLQVLDLKAPEDVAVFEHWATHLRFPTLQLIRLHMPEHRPAGDCQGAERFLLSLPPLSQIDLQHWCSPASIPSLVQHHGQHLVRLIISSPAGQCLTLNDVVALSECCPLLEDLTISIHRTQGDAEEVAHYKALGRIPRLQRLFLTLDISDPALNQGVPEDSEPPPDPSFSPFDQEFYEHDLNDIPRRARNGDIRRLIINASVDRSLALAIFHAIAPANSCASLAQLTLHTTPRVVNYHQDRYHTFGHLGAIFASSWAVECDRTFQHHQMHATDLNASDPMRTEHLDPAVEEIFYRIWPKHRPRPRKSSKKLQNKRDKERMGATSAWSRHWESLPLHTDPEE